MTLIFVQLNGRAGLESWRWLFIVEGLMPIAMALPVYFLLLTFPETSTALNERGLSIITSEIIANPSQNDTLQSIDFQEEQRDRRMSHGTTGPF
jgi:hypothetical protein